MSASSWSRKAFVPGGSISAAARDLVSIVQMSYVGHLSATRLPRPANDSGRWRAVADRNGPRWSAIRGLTDEAGSVAPTRLESEGLPSAPAAPADSLPTGPVKVAGRAPRTGSSPRARSVLHGEGPGPP